MKKHTLFVLISYIMWGLMPIFWKQLSEVSSLYILVSRIFWSFIFCTLILFIKRDIKSIKEVFKNKKETILLLLAGILIAANWGLYIYAVNSGKIIETSIAYYLSPIFSIFLGVLFFKEKLNFLQWIAVALSIIGVGVSILAYGKLPIMSLLICGTFGIYSLIKKFVISNSDTTIVIETLFLLPLTIVYIFFAEFNGNGAIGILPNWKLILIPMAGVLTSIPLLFFAKGIKETPFTLVGIIMFSSPTLALLIGVFLYNETFTLAHGITFIFIWAAAFCYILGMYKKSRKVAPTGSKS